MKIIPAHGTEQINFGSTKQDCIKTFGQPTKEIIDDGGNTILCYSNLGLGLKLEKENDDLLGWIQITNPKVTMFGIKPIGCETVGVIEKLKQELGSNIEEQDLGEWQSLTFEDHWLEIQTSLGFVQQVNFGVLYGEDGDPNWP